jgi:uncharacterized protein (TIGR02996 family)
MTQDEAFLQAILDAPEDDTPRLVYADWLEDHGQAERAQLIRLQCEAAALPWDDPRRPDLGKRSEHLLRKHRLEWLGPLPRGVRYDRFDRGLPVAKVAATARNFLARAAGWFSQTPQHVSFSVALSRVGMHWPAVLASPHLGRICELRVVVNEVGDAEVEALAACPSFGRLAGLDLFFNPLSDAAARALAASDNLGRLSHLKLSFTQIGPAGVEALVSSPWLGRLAMLDLQNTRVGDAGAAALAASPTAARLTWLSLAGCSIGEKGAEALASSPHLSGLSHLRLWSNGLGKRARQALRARFGNRVHLGPER